MTTTTCTEKLEFIADLARQAQEEAGSLQAICRLVAKTRPGQDDEDTETAEDLPNIVRGMSSLLQAVQAALDVIETHATEREPVESSTSQNGAGEAGDLQELVTA